MWKYQDFSATQNFRKIDFGHFQAPKTAILTIWAALNTEFLHTFDIFKCEIFEVMQSAQSAKIDFT